MSGIFLEEELLRSPAYWSLSKWAILVLQRFMQKRKLEPIKHKSKKKSYKIINNGQIIFTYREAVELGMNERQFRDAIDELIAKGHCQTWERWKVWRLNTLLYRQSMEGL